MMSNKTNCDGIEKITRESAHIRILLLRIELDHLLQSLFDLMQQPDSKEKVLRKVEIKSQLKLVRWELMRLEAI